MERNEDQWFDEELSKTLSEAVSSRQESGFSSREDFESWLRQGAVQQKRRRTRRFLTGSLAAAAVFACAVFLYNVLFTSAAVLPANAVLPWNPDSTYADTDSLTDPSITEESGSIVIGGDGNSNTDTWTATFTSYDDIPEKYKDEIIWFEELPEGYETDSISLKRDKNVLIIEIYFNKYTEKVLKVQKIINLKDKNGISIINQYDEILTCNGNTVYLKINAKNNLYMYAAESSKLLIYDYKKLEKEKIEVLITSIRTGLNR